MISVLRSFAHAALLLLLLSPAASALPSDAISLRSAPSSPHITRSLSITAPASPNPYRQVIDAAYQSYSIELSYLPDFAGNNTTPNTFSRQLLSNLCAIHNGVCPMIRVGGSTQNIATYYPNQTDARIQTIAPGADQPTALSLGTTWWQGFNQFPAGTKYVYGLSFFDGVSGLAQVVQHAKAAYAALGSSKVYAFEIGNEVDGIPGISTAPFHAGWTGPKSYVDQWLQYSDAVAGNLTGEAMKLFQGDVFVQPRELDSKNTSLWNEESVINLGILKTGRMKTFSEHDYMGAACGNAYVNLNSTLLNHYHMTSIAYYHSYLSNVTVAHNVPYVMGETNSIACQGKAGVSDVFAAALWSVDYVMYLATLNVSRVYFHMGTPYRYSPWQPIAINATERYVKPLYYGNLATAAALADDGGKKVEILVNETQFTAYGVYSASMTQKSSGWGWWGNRGSSDEAQLQSLVIVNLAMWNSTQSADQRPYTAVSVKDLAPGCDVSKGTVTRLTAPGVEVANGITWAGQTVDTNGNIVGRKDVEGVNGGVVLVGASEAVVVNI